MPPMIRANDAHDDRPPFRPLGARGRPAHPARRRARRPARRAARAAAGVAFSSLAGLPPQMGLAAAIVPCAIAALFGSSRHVVSGPTNAISLALLATLAPLAVVGSRSLRRARPCRDAARRRDAARDRALRLGGSPTSSRPRRCAASRPGRRPHRRPCADRPAGPGGAGPPRLVAPSSTSAAYRPRPWRRGRWRWWRCGPAGRQALASRLAALPPRPAAATVVAVVLDRFGRGLPAGRR